MRIAPIAWMTALAASAAFGQQASDLAAFHRSGQTFLTWSEVGSASGEQYRVYRHGVPITSANLSQATRVAEVEEGSSYWPDGATHPTHPIPRFIINDLGPGVPAGTGLFVNTPNAAGSFYYCVTAMVGGIENTANISAENSLASPLAETDAEPVPVVAWQSADGRGRQFIQYMDYDQWNPTFEGYAYQYWVGVPASYSFAGTDDYPLTVYLHGWGGREEVYDATPWDYETIYVTIDDPRQTWFFGFSGTYDFSAGGVPSTGPIVNFTEERILRSVYDTMRDARYRVDEDRIFAYGHSMGGSGSLALAMRYPNVFAAVYCSEPMTDYATSGAAGGLDWVPDCEAKWGSVGANLPVENRGRFAAPLAAYDGTGVWDWQDHQANLSGRRSDEMAFIGIYHGSLDDVIDWETQGNPVYDDFYAGRRAFSGAAYVVDHTWVGFSALGPTVGEFDWQPFYGFAVRRDQAFPAFTFASGSSSAPPGTGPAEYNLNLEWAAAWYTWPGSVAMVDSPAAFQVHVRSTSGTQIVDVTPRRTEQFPAVPGASYAWQTRNPVNGSVIASGTVVADADSLVTVASVSVPAGDGVLLRLEALGPVPVNDLSITPSGSTVILAWSPQAGMTYRVYQGLQAYALGSQTAAGVLPPWTSGALDPVQASFFRVRGDTGSELGPLSNGVGVMPFSTEGR